MLFANYRLDLLDHSVELLAADCSSFGRAGGADELRKRWSGVDHSRNRFFRCPVQSGLERPHMLVYGRLSEGLAWLALLRRVLFKSAVEGENLHSVHCLDRRWVDELFDEIKRRNDHLVSRLLPALLLGEVGFAELLPRDRISDRLSRDFQKAASCSGGVWSIPSHSLTAPKRKSKIRHWNRRGQGQSPA